MKKASMHNIYRKSKKYFSRIKSVLLSDLKLPRWFKTKQPIYTLRAATRILFYKTKRLLRLDSSFYMPIESDMKIDLFMPTLEKDAKVLDICLENAKIYIKHPIGNIYIVAPRNAKNVKKIADKHGCKFVDEDSILPIRKNEIRYVHNGEDRSGWIFKMLLNLSADKACKEKNILILDADTVFIRPTIFIYKNKPIYNESTLFHKPYFDTNQRIFELKHPSSLSYITHYQLFQSDILKQLRIDIEKYNNKPWYEAIIDNLDTNEGSTFADYEIYADYYIHRLNKPAIVNYWVVKDSGINGYDEFLLIKNKLSKKYGAVALHNYDRNE